MPSKLHIVGEPLSIQAGRILVDVSDDIRDRVEALIVEEDTFFVLSAPPEVHPVTAHPLRIYTAVNEVKPAALGTIRVHDQSPLLIQAVVDALDADPPGSMEAVRQALCAVAAEIQRRDLTRVGLELLGAIHGGLDAGEVAKVIVERVLMPPPSSLKCLAIVARSRDRDRVAEIIRGAVER